MPSPADTNAATPKRTNKSLANATIPECHEDPSDPISLRRRRKRERMSSPHFNETKLRSVITKTTHYQPHVQYDGASQLATARNDKRFQAADDKDQEVLRKYLPDDVSSFLPAPVEGPDDNHGPPLHFLHKLRAVATTHVPTPAAPPFRFNTSVDALCHNEGLLRTSNFSIEALLQNHQDSTLGYGSEFRPVEQLRSILGTHPQFPALETICREGMNYRFHTELSDATELSAMVERGNHKSAENEPGVVNKLLLKDVTHGFSLPIPPKTVALIPGGLVQPLGLAKQWTLNEKGRSHPKISAHTRPLVLRLPRRMLRQRPHQHGTMRQDDI
jgi:hypothetical protein